MSGDKSDETGKASGQGTREALMEAALRLLERDGVLAGLNITEVAKEVGVTPANIYHYFKSRQGLLRAAINRRMEQLTLDVVRERGELPWTERAKMAFEFVRENPELSLVALLALDNDDEFVLAPYLESARGVLRRDAKMGRLRDDLDLEVMHMLFGAFEYGYAIFSQVGARQLEMPLEEFHRRAQTVIDHVVMSMSKQPAPG